MCRTRPSAPPWRSAPLCSREGEIAPRSSTEWTRTPPPRTSEATAAGRVAWRRGCPSAGKSKWGRGSSSGRAPSAGSRTACRPRRCSSYQGGCQCFTRARAAAASVDAAHTFRSRTARSLSSHSLSSTEPRRADSAASVAARHACFESFEEWTPARRAPLSPPLSTSSSCAVSGLCPPSLAAPPSSHPHEAVSPALQATAAAAASSANIVVFAPSLRTLLVVQLDPLPRFPLRPAGQSRALSARHKRPSKVGARVKTSLLRWMKEGRMEEGEGGVLLSLSLSPHCACSSRALSPTLLLYSVLPFPCPCRRRAGGGQARASERFILFLLSSFLPSALPERGRGGRGVQ